MPRFGRLGKKFKVTYHSIEDLEARLNSDPPPDLLTRIFTSSMLEVARGRFDLKDLNINKLLPDVKPVGIEEFLQTWWGGKGDA